MKVNIIKIVLFFSLTIPFSVPACLKVQYYFPGPFETQTYNPVTKDSIVEMSIIYGLKKIPQENVMSLKKFSI